MAIVVEEGSRRNNILPLVGWVAFLIIAAGAVYYIFFAQPELVAIPASGNLSIIAPLTQLNTNPNGIVTGQQFLSLHNTIAPPQPSGPVTVGRTNPFIAP